MAAAVLESLERSRDLIVEAGTGVGKSLAYLLPGAMWAAAGGRENLDEAGRQVLQQRLAECDAASVASNIGEFGAVLEMLRPHLTAEQLPIADEYLRRIDAARVKLQRGEQVGWL